jgi:RNA polymerase sigma factor (TIGR02999 family)
MSDVTRILSQIESGDPSAAEQLLPLVYDELRKLAAARLAQEKPGQTLQATAAVHDAYLRLVDVEKAQHWDSRGHFFAAAAEAIRRILVENARKRDVSGTEAVENGSIWSKPFRWPKNPAMACSLWIEALTRFAVLEPVKAELVKLRYFAGCSIDEAADLLGISRTSAKRYWAFARAWLLAELHDSDDFRNS